jgi:hypothetical protein
MWLARCWKLAPRIRPSEMTLHAYPRRVLRLFEKVAGNFSDALEVIHSRGGRKINRKSPRRRGLGGLDNLFVPLVQSCLVTDDTGLEKVNNAVIRRDWCNYRRDNGLDLANSKFMKRNTDYA